MARLHQVSPETATGKTKELYDAFNANLGAVPNMMRTMANAPALLEGYFNLSKALGSGKLGARIGELIALTVAQLNSCNYCLSAHTFIGTNLLKINGNALADARWALGDDPKIDAILRFAKSIVTRKGQVSNNDLDSVRRAGVSDNEIAEIIGHVGMNILTNYFNLVAETEIDFPPVFASAESVN